jgi:NADPH2:quinone reductase
MVTYGAIGGTVPTVTPRSLSGLRYVTGLSIMAWRAARPDLARADMTEAAGHWSAGRLRTAVHATFPLTGTARAHELLERRANLGRIVITT